MHGVPKVDEDPPSDTASIHGGTKKALARICGVCQSKLTHGTCLALLKVLELQIRQRWGQGKPRVRMPRFTYNDLKSQLCAWSHNEFMDSWTNYARTMHAACVL